MTTTSLGRKAIRTAALAAGLAIAPLLALAQDFPQRPLTLVVPYPAGGPADGFGRALQGRQRETLRHQFEDHRPVFYLAPQAGDRRGENAPVV